MRTAIIVPSSGSIDMYEDVSTPLNFSVADIRYPEKRSASYSKTIKIPGTKNNNILFGNIFNVNISTGAFNPNAKLYCQLLIDEEVQIDGYLQMLNIIIVDTKVEYECAIIGSIGNIFTDIGSDELTDLSFVEFNHTYDYATQSQSSGNIYSDGYCYPLIDYGFNSDKTEIDVEQLLPAIFAWQYIKKIFQAAGYSYTSTFLDGAIFKKLVIPSNGLTVGLTFAQVALRLFEARQTTATSVSFNTGGDVAKYNNEITDVSSQHNTSTGEFTAANSGYYNISGTGTFTITGTWTESILRIEKYDGAFWNYIDETRTYTNNPSPHTVWIGVANYYLAAGEKIRITVNVLGTSGSFTFNSGTFKNEVVNNGLIEGDTLDISQCLPKKIKQKDFLLSIIKMFNLYIDIDKNNDRNLIIETRDTFYNQGVVIDWTDKLDYSKNIEYKPMGALDVKEFRYKFKDDEDYFNKEYKKLYNESYGTYRKINDNEFLNGLSETEVIFSPTPLVGDNASDRVIPVIWDDQNSPVIKGFNIRILYFGGLKQSNVQYNYKGRVSGSHMVTEYNYAGHLDSVTAPTIDINFDSPRALFYSTSVYSSNNLYHAYHSKFITEITDRDSKITTAYFHLLPSDIRNLDFRNRFYFDNQYFRLNKIYDYDPIKNEVVKCEFLLMLDAASFIPVTHVINGGLFNNANSVDNYKPRIVQVSNDADNNIEIVGQSRSLVAGSGNVLNSNLTKAIIQGKDNIIGDSENVTLLASSGNIIGSGFTNITLINTFDTTVEESNVVLVGGVDISKFIVPQLVYEGFITQSGGGNPTVDILVNTFGDVTWTQIVDGAYQVIPDAGNSNLFTDRRTSIQFGNHGTASLFFPYAFNYGDYIYFYTYDTTFTLANSLFNSTYFKITVY